MVKGTSRRVIVVDSPDTDLFEQAIFIVRNDAMHRGGVTSQQLVDEACRVARSCSRSDLGTQPFPQRHAAFLECDCRRLYCADMARQRADLIDTTHICFSPFEAPPALLFLRNSYLQTV